MHDALEIIRKEASKTIQQYLAATNKTLAMLKKARKKQLQRLQSAVTKEDSISHVPETQTQTPPSLEQQLPEIVLPWACQLSLDSILELLPVVVCISECPHDYSNLLINISMLFNVVIDGYL